jgi:hypothetical protein
VQLDEALHHGQTDAKAPARPIDGGVELGEQLEDVGQHLGRDALAGVANAEHGLIAVASEGDLDLTTRRGVDGGIVQQVDDHLLETDGVGIDGERRRGVATGDPVPTRLDEPARRFKRLPQDIGKIQPRLAELDLAGGDAGDVEEIVE